MPRTLGNQLPDKSSSLVHLLALPYLELRHLHFCYRFSTLKTNCSCGSKQKLSDFKSQLVNLSLLSKPGSHEAKAGGEAQRLQLRGQAPSSPGRGGVPDTQLSLELSRNGERTARFRCALI